MMQFQYLKVSEKNSSFSSYRGIKVLSSLFETVLKELPSDNNNKSLYPIHLVRSVPGHLAVSFHDGRQFVVFDAVPHQLRLSSIEEMKLQRFVLKEINDYLKNILAMKTLSHVIHLSFLNPSSDTSKPSNISQTEQKQQKQKQSNIGGVNARKLQLLAVHSDGGIIIWNWNQIRYLWQYKIRKILPSPLSDYESRINYMNNTNNKLYEKERPGILVFCNVITCPSHLIKIPYLNQNNKYKIKESIKSQNEKKYIDAFENLLYPQQNVFVKRNYSKSINNNDGSLYFLMIDYMLGDSDMIENSNDNIYNIHRYLLNKNFPAIKTKKLISTRFIISRVRLNVDYKNINTPMMGGASQPSQNVDQSKFEDFRILMDGLEEIDFWKDYYAEKNDEEEEENDETDTRRRVILVIENIWTSRYGFIIEITVRRTNTIRKMTAASMQSSRSDTSSQAAYDINLSEITIEKRLLYYVSPFMNQMIRIPFPNTKLTVNQYNNTKQKRKAKDDKIRKNSKSKSRHKLSNENLLRQQQENKRMTDATEKKINITFVESAKQEITRFMIGQHGTTKQLLLWDRFDNSFYILDENQLPSSSLSEYLYNYNKNKRDQFEKHSSKLSTKMLKSLKPKFDLPFGHFSDKSRRIEWKYICRFDLPNESFYDPTRIISDTSISKKYKGCNEQLKIWGYHDWICVNITHDVFYIHLTNIVLHRRYLFHQYTHYKKYNDEDSDSDNETDDEIQNKNGIKLQFPSPVYLSALYKEVNPSIPQRHQSFNLKQVTQRRRLFSHEWSYYSNDKPQEQVEEEKEEKDDIIRDDSEEWKEDDHEILACAISSLPPDVENVNNYFVVSDFGICTRDSIFRLNIHGLHEQVEAVNSCYEPCQAILGGLNLLSRWGQTSLIARSKYLTDFLYQQSLFTDEIKSQQIKEALKIAPFPLLVALLYKYPQFDTLLLRHYQRTRDDFPKFTFNYGRIFGKKVMQNILYYMDHIYKNQAPLPILNSAKKQSQKQLMNTNISTNVNRPSSFIAQDLAILSGEVSMEYDEDIMSDMISNTIINEQENEDDIDDDLLVDMDEIRTLISSDSLSDLNVLEKKLKLNGIRNDPFDPATFQTNPQFLCRILLLPASFRSNHEIEVTTPLNLLASLCRFYDSIYPVATFRLIQLLCHYQGTSSKKIALSALQGLPNAKHNLTELPTDEMIFNKETDIKNKKQFDLFEERIVSRIILCKIAHQFYDMLDNLLMIPLTLPRLKNAISTAKRFNERLTDIQKVAIFKRLLSAWIQVKMREYHSKDIVIHKQDIVVKSTNGKPEVKQEEVDDGKKEQRDIIMNEVKDNEMKEEEEEEYENITFNSDWILELRPHGYNGFHFMKHIMYEISYRKEKKIKKIIEKINKNNDVDNNKKELRNILNGEIPILAGEDDIPVSVLRPVLMFFASELHQHR